MDHLSLYRLVPGNENSFEEGFCDRLRIILKQGTLIASFKPLKTWEAIAQLCLRKHYCEDDFLIRNEFSLQKFVEKLANKRPTPYNLSLLLADLKKHRPPTDCQELETQLVTIPPPADLPPLLANNVPPVQHQVPEFVRKRFEAAQEVIVRDFPSLAHTLNWNAPAYQPPSLPAESDGRDKEEEEEEEERALREAEELIRQKREKIAAREERMRRLREEEQQLEEQERMAREKEEAMAKTKTLNWDLNELHHSSKISVEEQNDIPTTLKKFSIVPTSRDKKIWEAIGYDFLQRAFLEDDFTRHQRFDYQAFITKMSFQGYTLRMLFRDLVKHDPDYKAPVAYRNAL